MVCVTLSLEIEKKMEQLDEEFHEFKLHLEAYQQKVREALLAE
jgi:hypothetical protein